MKVKKFWQVNISYENGKKVYLEEQKKKRGVRIHSIPNSFDAEFPCIANKKLLDPQMGYKFWAFQKRF